MELQIALPCSQQFASGPYYEPDESSPAFTPHLFKNHFNIILHCTYTALKQSLPFRFSDNNSVYISYRSHSCYIPRPHYLLDLITSYNKNILKIDYLSKVKRNISPNEEQEWFSKVRYTGMYS
jgi:hypothetical protein